MAGIADFLKYLARDDVNEVVLQSGAAAAVRVGSELRPLTSQPLSARHIVKLLQPTTLLRALPTKDGSTDQIRATIAGSEYVATLLRSGETLLVRLQAAPGPDSGDGGSPGAMDASALFGDLQDGSDLTSGSATDVAGAQPLTKIGDDEDIAIDLPPVDENDPVTTKLDSPVPRGRPIQSSAPPARVAAPVPVPAAPAATQAVVPRAARAPAPQPHAHGPQPATSRRSIAPPKEKDDPLADFVPVHVNTDAPGALIEILREARAKAASDVHVMSGEPVRMRCFGELEPVGEPLDHETVKALLRPLLNRRNLRQFDDLGYADFGCQVEGGGRLRVNMCQQRLGYKGCFRLIMDDPPTLESLRLPPELRQISNYHQGLVVVSGPNGAGKTTTLGALVDLFNSERACHIITVEDPVEIVHPIKKAIVSQRETGSHTVGPHAALKGALREDPDIIGIGELRDRETVEKSLEAAETGHLVFATMSTPSGSSTIDRLIDMFPPDDQSQVRATLAGTLKFIVSQRLIPRADGQGRVAAVELLTGNLALWNLIRDDKLFQLPSLLQRGRAFGMIRIEDSLNELIQAGLISEEVAKKYADDPRAIGQPARAAAAAQAVAAGQQEKRGLRNLFGKKGE